MIVLCFSDTTAYCALDGHRAGGDCCDQCSYSSRCSRRDRGGAPEPRGPVTHRLPHCCQPVPGRALQPAARLSGQLLLSIPPSNVKLFLVLPYKTSLNFLSSQNKAGLTHEELCVAVEMLSAVSVLNEVLDTKDSVAIIEQLSDSPLGFSGLDADNLQRYSDTTD